MRMGFGLLALLVTMGIIVMMMKIQHPADVARQGETMKKQASQYAGRDEDGTPARDTIKMSTVESGGKLKYVLVENLVAGGAFERFYGLKRDDCITGTSAMDFRDLDSELAMTMVLDAYSKKGELKVVRGGQKLTLPTDKETPVQPGQPQTKQPKSDGSSLQQQLDAIPGIAR